jgi:hypothetical protein
LLYKIRWQIELLFKQIKQNFPLKYFLGDNENAIKIQIVCLDSKSSDGSDKEKFEKTMVIF